MQRRHFIGQIVLVSAILDSKVYRNSAYQPMQRTTTRQSVDEILRLVAKTAATPDDHAPMQDQNFVLEFRLYLADTRFCCVVFSLYDRIPLYFRDERFLESVVARNANRSRAVGCLYIQLLSWNLWKIVFGTKDGIFIYNELYSWLCVLKTGSICFQNSRYRRYYLAEQYIYILLLYRKNVFNKYQSVETVLHTTKNIIEPITTV